MLNEYKARRDQVLAWLAEEPRLECAVPQGAFYLFPSVSEFLSPDGHRTSLEFADALLRDEHVVTTAGEAFDTPGFIRLSYATSLDRLREGVTRLIASRERLLTRGTGLFSTVWRNGDRPRRVRLAAHDALACPAPCVLRPVPRTVENRPVPLADIVGPEYVRTDEASRERYGVDGLKRGHPPDVVVLPGTTAESRRDRAAAATRRGRRSCPAGRGTGYTGGAVPVRGGVVVSLERLNRILEIDEANLLAVVEPNVITGDLQDAVERVGLFYPPDPASLRQSVIGGNVARERRRPARVQVRRDRSTTCSASKPCCRPARSSRPAARP